MPARVSVGAGARPEARYAERFSKGRTAGVLLGDRSRMRAVMLLSVVGRAARIFRRKRLLSARSKRRPRSRRSSHIQ